MKLNQIFHTSFRPLVILLVLLSLHQTDIHACNIKADFTYTITDVHLVKFTNTSTGAHVYQWDFGNAFTSSEFSPQMFYNVTRTTTFIVSLLAIDTLNNNCVDTIRKLIEIYIPDCHTAAYFDVDADSSKNFSGIVYNSSHYSRPGKTVTTWYFGDGDSSASVSPTHIYPGPGTYQLCIKLADSTCVSMHCDSITFDTSGAMKRGIKYSIKVEGGPNSSIQEDHFNRGAPIVFPNPGNGIATITHDRQIKTIMILNIEGRILLSVTAGKMSAEIDFRQYPAGPYCILVTDDLDVMHKSIFIKDNF